MQHDVLLSTVETQLMSEVSRVYKETNSLSDELLSALQFIYQTSLMPALDIIDRKAVTLLECPSKRQLYTVMGTSGIVYICFPDSKYCSCPAYNYSVLLKDDHIMCKHILAIKLSNAMNVTVRRNISDKEMRSMLLHME
ncbi:finger SWIM domain-containing 7-like [Octopus vulgaris]|uniref:Finger SWIM domain-containing 7-like n=2 Tax=Octopus TaxID=6643 RepID=A0AA36AGN8_OCTVU|nr:zinc finger SWIM domain-containing protein 7 isoform X1 [Octopus sinensis]CAI9715001.1 finger SWIM domain-containing 7-like [Octopus vulgaris]